MEDKELIARVLTENLWEFHQRVLQADNPDNKMGKIHKELCQVMDSLDNTNTKRSMILLPRGHLKSSLITVGWSIQQVCKNPNIRILIGSETNAKAKDFLKQIRDTFEKNERVIYLYGDHVRTQSRWTDDEITSALRTTTSIKEPTVFTTGTDQTRTGSHCFSPGTWINTGDGLKTVSELTLNDTLLTQNGEYRRIAGLKKQIVPRRMVKVAGFPAFPMQVSEDHPFLMEDGSFKQAGDLEKGDKIRRPKHKGKYYSDLPDDQELWWVLGWWVAEGSITLNAGKRVTFTMHTDEKKEALEIARILGKYSEVNAKFTKPRGNGIQMYVSGVDSKIVNKMREMYRGPFRKALPVELYNANRESRIAFLKGIWQGDGTARKNDRGQWEGNLTTVSEEIALGVTQLIHELGINCSVGKVGNKINDEMKECYRVYFKAGVLGLFDKKYITKKRKGNFFVRDASLSEVLEVETIYSSDVISISMEGKPTYSIPQAVSHNCDIAILDDPVSHTNINTKEAREKTLKWFREIANNILDPGGNLIVIGTRWHFADIYQYILDELSDVFQVFHHQALTDEGYDLLRKDLTLEEKNKLITPEMLLFPEKFNVQQLWEIYSGNSNEFFNNQYMNRIVDSEDADFKEQDIQYYDPADRLPYMNKYIGIDPAIADQGDFTAIICVGIDENSNWYVLEYENIHAKPEEILNRTFEMYNRHKEVRKIGIETAAYQKALVYSFKDEMRKREIHLPIVEVTRGGRNSLSKEQRILSLQPIVAQKRLHVQKGMVELREQLRTFPKSKYDDVIDALATVNEIAVGFRRNKAYNEEDETREERDDRLALVGNRRARKGVTGY